MENKSFGNTKNQLWENEFKVFKCFRMYFKNFKYRYSFVRGEIL